MSRISSRLHAVLRGLVLAGLALAAAAACGAPRPASRGGGERDAKELAEAVERLRLERRLRERKIRDLENQLNSRASASASATADAPMPPLPVQVLAPDGEPAARPPGAAPRDPSVSRLSDEASSEISIDGERIVGVADDGTEIVYIDDAATGRVVSPSAEVLAEVGRPARRPSAVRGDGPEIDEGEAQALLEAAEGERLPMSPAPLASIGRRAARTRATPTRLPAHAPPPSSPSPSSSAPSPGGTSTMIMPVAGPLHTGTSAAPPPRATAKPAPPQPTVRGSDSGTAETHYRAAIAMVRRAEYPAAIASLREFLQKYPRHDYADNAQYWLGESFYAQQQFDQALLELRRVVDGYPQGNKVPDALLKVGYCHLAMGDREKSTRVLREVIRLFPRTQPALLATKKLEEAGQ